MARYGVDRNGNLVQLDQTVSVPAQEADPLTTAAIAALSTRKHSIPWGHAAFLGAWAGFAVLLDLQVIGWSRGPADVALVAVGTMLVVESAIRSRQLFLELVDTITRRLTTLERSRIYLEHQRAKLATRRTMERRLMAQVLLQEAQVTARAVEAGQRRRMAGDAAANQLHNARRDLLAMLAETYSEGVEKRWSGGQPFALRRIGRARYEALKRAGFVYLSGSHPQWAFDATGETPEQALDRILNAIPDYCELED